MKDKLIAIIAVAGFAAGLFIGSLIDTPLTGGIQEVQASNYWYDHYGEDEPNDDQGDG